MLSPKISLKEKEEALFKFHGTDEGNSCSFGSLKCGMTVFGISPAS